MLSLVLPLFSVQNNLETCHFCYALSKSAIIIFQTVVGLEVVNRETPTPSYDTFRSFPRHQPTWFSMPKVPAEAQNLVRMTNAKEALNRHYISFIPSPRGNLIGTSSVGTDDR